MAYGKRTEQIRASQRIEIADPFLAFLTCHPGNARRYVYFRRFVGEPLPCWQPATLRGERSAAPNGVIAASGGGIVLPTHKLKR